METFYYFNSSVGFYLELVTYADGDVFKHAHPWFEGDYLEYEGTEGWFSVDSEILLLLTKEWNPEFYATLGIQEQETEEDDEESRREYEEEYNLGLYLNEITEVEGYTLRLSVYKGEVTFSVDNLCFRKTMEVSHKTKVRMVRWGIKTFKKYVKTLESGCRLECLPCNDDGFGHKRASLYEALGFSRVDHTGRQTYTV